MQYMIDFLVSTVKALGPETEPVMFQREKGLYVMSGNVVGHISPALDTMKPATARELDALFASKQVSLPVSEGEVQGFADDEGRRIRPMLWAPESYIKLEDLVNTGAALQEIDDGKVRVIGGMRSHPASRSTDHYRSVIKAHVMNRDRYLGLMRKHENWMFRELGTLARRAEKGKPPKPYAPQQFMDCMILTPYLLVSFPRHGALNNDGWTGETRVKDLRGRILDYPPFDVSLSDQESPFAVYATMNAQHVKAQRPSELRHQCEDIYEEIKRQCMVLERRMGSISQKIAQLNGLHNRANKRYIEDSANEDELLSQCVDAARQQADKAAAEHAGKHRRR